MAAGKDRWHESLRGLLNDLLGRLPGWPDDRMTVTWMTWIMAIGMLIMAKNNMELWKEDLYKGLLMLVVGTGFVNMILAYHFSANKADAQRGQNTAHLAEALAEQSRTARTIADTAAAVAGTVQANGNGNGNGHEEEDSTTAEVELAPGETVEVAATEATTPPEEKTT